MPANFLLRAQNSLSISIWLEELSVPDNQHCKGDLMYTIIDSIYLCHVDNRLGVVLVVAGAALSRPVPGSGHRAVYFVPCIARVARGSYLAPDPARRSTRPYKSRRRPCRRKHKSHPQRETLIRPAIRLERSIAKEKFT